MDETAHSPTRVHPRTRRGSRAARVRPEAQRAHDVALWEYRPGPHAVHRPKLASLVDPSSHAQGDGHGSLAFCAVKNMTSCRPPPTPEGATMTLGSWLKVGKTTPPSSLAARL